MRVVELAVSELGVQLHIRHGTDSCRLLGLPIDELGEISEILLKERSGGGPTCNFV